MDVNRSKQKMSNGRGLKKPASDHNAHGIAVYGCDGGSTRSPMSYDKSVPLISRSKPLLVQPFKHSAWEGYLRFCSGRG